VGALQRWRATSITAGRIDSPMMAKITREKFRRTTGMLPKR
jgi:hypothetical protein